MLLRSKGSSMPHSRSFLAAVVLLLFLAGCSHGAIRYTWTGDEARVKETRARCVEEVNKNYVPRAAAGRVIPTLYKDCMEKAGNTKSGSDLVPLIWDEKLWQWRPEPPHCGATNQACIWVPPA